MTIYIVGVMEHRHSVKDIHRHAMDHLRQWFPKLPKYEALNARLSFLTSAFEHLSPLLERRIAFSSVMENIRLIDSMPIILAKSNRADTARVAREICDKGYCPSKKLYYHGLKLHAVGLKRFGLMPRIEHLSFTPASNYDVLEFRALAPTWFHCDVMAKRVFLPLP